jgi:hypothetical protein
MIPIARSFGWEIQKQFDIGSNIACGTSGRTMPSGPILVYVDRTLEPGGSVRKVRSIILVCCPTLLKLALTVSFRRTPSASLLPSIYILLDLSAGDTEGSTPRNQPRCFL